MRTTTIAAAVLAAMAAAPVAAQEQAPAAGQDQNAWIKICNTDPDAKKELCLTTQELRTNSGQFLASIAIRESAGEQRKVLLASVPVGMVIKPGVNLQIDGGPAQKVDYSICFPNACYAEWATDQGYVNKLKGGGKLSVTTFNQQGKTVRFDMTLKGFTAANDGPGINPADLQQKQADLQKQLDERAKQARDKLVAEQRRAVEDAGTAQ